MANDLADHEITRGNFIQLDFSGVIPTTSAVINISSVQLGESGTVYATKTASSLAGAIFIQTLFANGSVDVTSYVNAGYYY